MHLQVSQENARRLGKLAALTDDQFIELVETLERGVPTVADGEAVHDALLKLKLSSPEDAFEIAQAVFPLLFTFVAEGRKPADVVAGVVSGLRTKADSARSMSTLRKRLAVLLGSKALSLKAKAAALFVNRGAILTGCKVITDVRPVFPVQSVATVEAFTVIHTLVLEISEDGSDRSLHLAIDRTDLAELKRAIERAEAKEKTTIKWIGTTGTTQIDVA